MLLFGRPQMGDGLNFGISEWAKIIARHGNDDDAILVGRGNLTGTSHPLEELLGQ